jgi:glycine cleavage system H lipoate-binding protein
LSLCAGWLAKIEVSNPEEMDDLLDDKEYKKVCEEDDD